MTQIFPADSAILAPAPRREARTLLRRNVGPVLVVVGLALTVLWLGIMAYGAVMLAGIAI